VPGTKTERGYYFGARYYASTMGSFLSPDYNDAGDVLDPVPHADFENPQSLNLYNYVWNRSLSMIDPDGHGGPCGQHGTYTQTWTGSNEVFDRSSWSNSPCPTFAPSQQFGVSFNPPARRAQAAQRSFSAGTHPDPTDCKYIEPLSAGIFGGIKAKFGPELEFGDLTVGLSFDKALGENDVSSEAAVGAKGVASIQRTCDPAMAGGAGCRNSITFFGAIVDLSTGTVTFNPGAAIKQLKLGLVAGAGVEWGFNLDAYNAAIYHDIACHVGPHGRE
jgi:RHS repeat-associated protein